MMNRAVLPAEWRDRNGGLYTPVRRNADGSVEYRLAASHRQPPATGPGLGRSPAAARGAEDVHLLSDKIRALGLGKKPPPPQREAARGLFSERSAPGRDQLDRFRAALATVK